MLARPRLAAQALLVLLGTAATATPAKNRPRGGEPEFVAGADQSPASRAARLTLAACHTELDRLGVRFIKVAKAPGVKIPVRLLGPVGGVVYRTDYPDAERSRVPYEIFDCRLVVVLAAFGPVLRAHDIDEVRIFSAWRPPPRAFPAGKVTNRHPGGLAADLRLFKKSSGEELDVEADFHGKIGAEPCGPSKAAPSPESAAASELRSILCSAAEGRLFHVLLSPNFDRRHRNHFHVEVRPDVRWFIVR